MFLLNAFQWVVRQRDSTRILRKTKTGYSTYLVLSLRSSRIILWETESRSALQSRRSGHERADDLEDERVKSCNGRCRYNGQRSGAGHATPRYRGAYCDQWRP